MLKTFYYNIYRPIYYGRHGMIYLPNKGIRVSAFLVQKLASQEK